MSLKCGGGAAWSPPGCLISPLSRWPNRRSLRSSAGDVADSGEGRWTVEAAIDEAVAAPVITSALYARFRSRIEHSFGEKLLSAMRNEFGGHVESITPAHKAKDGDK